MASHDVRDVLNLPQDGGGAPRPAKKQKTSGARPNLKGLAREVQNLGGDNPIAIVPQVSVFKKRRLAIRKPAARWELRRFRNSARSDASLLLRHWRRKHDAATGQEQEAPAPAEDAPMENGGDAPAGAASEPLPEDSTFAKFNVRVTVPQYDENQYNANLKNEDWTKDETDYLLQVVQDFDLRWPLIWDRYDYQPPAPPAGDGDNSTAVVLLPKTRTMEDLKARYYQVAAKMMAAQTGIQYMTQAQYGLYETMATFNPQQEKLRKDFALNSLSRSREEAREEESLLLEVKRILARMEKFNEERRELYRRLDYPTTEADVNIAAFKSSAGLQTLLHNLMSVDKSKKRKSLMGADGVSPGTAAAGAQPAGAVAEGGRRDSIAASTAQRDSLGGADKLPEPPKNNKKGQQHSERRKLTEQEEQIYGVSHHDRLSSGATFRFEKVNKLFTTKSGQQQLRITNVLNQLEIPNRLVMPTAAVAAEFESLISIVTQLVDLRKVADKVDAEVKIEEQRKLERDKARGIVPPAGGAGDGTAQEGRKAAAPPGASEGEAGAASAKEDGGEQETVAVVPPAAGATVDGASINGVQIKEEEAEKERTAVRPGSSGAHKRSASVLSTTSEKSAKRQRK